MPSNEFFRAGVGIVVVDTRGLVLGLERADVNGGWQFPQGGIEIHEEPLDAARRELWEETGIGWTDVTLIDEHPAWLAYELPKENRGPKTGRGQVHRWFLVRHTGSEDAIRLTPANGEQEFRRWRWMPFADLVEKSWDVRWPVYQELQSYWADRLR